MVFSSITFLFAFLAAVLLLYFVCPLKGKNWLLALSGLVFYAWGEPVYIFLMLFSTLVDYTAGRVIDRYRDHPGIRKAALIADMVQSIAQIPDPIQRSVYIKECARIMDIDEQILISEVARKRMTTSGDRETDEFLRRQTTLRQREAQQPGVEFVKQVEAGSSFETLEREIVKYLLKYGHCSFDFKEGRTMVACNVAEVIFSELSDDNIAFRNPVYNKIMAAYREQWAQLGTGVEVPAHVFLNHIDPEVCNMSVDILTSDDNYVASELWRRKEIHIDTDAEMLAVGVPKAVTLYKSKVIEALIKELQGRLGDENISDEEMRDVVQRLTAYNQVKVTIANKIQRLIL